MRRSLSSVLVLAIPLGCASVLGIDGNYVGTQEAGLVSGGGSATGGLLNDTGGTESGGTSGSGGTPSGGRSSGGTSAAGGAGTGGSMTGGTAGSSGGAASCDSDGASCPSGQKCCPAPMSAVKACIDPLPIVGCEALGCTPCTAPPPDGVLVCVAGQCDFECVNGTTRNGSVCESTGTGGAGGAGGGTGGVPPVQCVAKNCPTCGLIGPFGCCRNNNSCGCTYAPGPVCY